MSDLELFERVKPRNTVDYMLRTTQQHHVQLSMMADIKANILIGAAFLMLTITFGHMQSNGASLALITLSAFTLLAAICALMAVMPSYRSKSNTAFDSKRFNPLFFSNFSRMEQDEYLKYMDNILFDDKAVYTTVLKDIYQLGMVLQRKKFRYLSYSYRIFLFGLIVTFMVIFLDWVVGNEWPKF